jgi:hypothetical protein
MQALTATLLANVDGSVLGALAVVSKTFGFARKYTVFDQLKITAPSKLYLI